MSRRALLVSACLMFSISVASAHTTLESPAPRSLQDDIDDGPCGDAPRTAPTVWEAGAQVTVSWFENVNHPGFFALAIAPENDVGFEQNVIDGNIPDIDCATPPCRYTLDITVPNTPCELCTLQLIHWMGGEEPYHSCADISIVAADETPPDEDPPMDGDDSPASPSKSKSGGGCSAGGSAAGAILLLGLLSLVLAMRRYNFLARVIKKI